MIFRRLSLFLICLHSFAWGSEWALQKNEALAAPEGLRFSKLTVAHAGDDAVLHVVSFSAKTHTFAVMDDPENAYDLASAAQKRGALAAVNGGYFHPDRKPLGLLVRQGRELHPLERAKLLSGLLVVTDQRIALLRVGEFKRSPQLREAVQAGPFLVDGGKAVSGLNDTRRALRTVVFSGSNGQFGLAISSSVTLAQMGAILATPGLLPDLKITRALNLDGGSSTGMWVTGAPPFYRSELRDVRNFLGIVRR
jgi:uncharacterized protein YigE (DUF2233 family)